MNLDRLLPKTSFGRFFLINVISLALFWLLIQPMANYWRNQALFRMVASNESRLFLTHIRLLDKLPTIAERNGLFNPNDDVFSIRVSHLPPDMPRDGSNCSQSLRRRLERAFKQENIRYTDLLTRIVVSHAPITVMGSEEKYSDLETFLTHHYMAGRNRPAQARRDLDLRQAPDRNHAAKPAVAEYGGAGDRIPPGQDRGWLGAELAAAALAQAGGGNRALRQDAGDHAAADGFRARGSTRGRIRVQQDVFEYSAIIRGTGTLPDVVFA